eukprot:2462092-Alexandrium_andersonii.AAC.1
MFSTRWAVPILRRARGREQPPEGTFVFPLPPPPGGPWALLPSIPPRSRPGFGLGPGCRAAATGSHR